LASKERERALTHELLTPKEMGQADRLTIENGPPDGPTLMRNAGQAVAAAILERYPGAAAFDVLCGPGNNGGDGYVVASLLGWSGAEVRLWRDALPRAGSDAALAAKECEIAAGPLREFHAKQGSVVIDALFGAGLSKPLEGVYAQAVEKLSASGASVVAVDLPSGISGETGRALGAAASASLTVTFFRKKPGHLLYPGRAHCGETIVADIGIRADVLEVIGPACFENAPAIWAALLPVPAVDTHKYERGHAAVLSGGPFSTGAARLAAMGAARAGAGAVTVLSPASAAPVNAAHLTSIMVRQADSKDEVAAFLRDRKVSALVAGPGLGTEGQTGEFLRHLLETGKGILRAIVFDADAITVMAGQPEAFFYAARQEEAPSLVLTPHEGEFGRLFPDLARDAGLSKLDKARAAASRANAVLIYKGPDTVISSPNGRAAINANGTPWLATAGSGDVLGGICAGFLAQGMPAFDAACAAVWIHAEAARRFGPGLMADDLPATLPQVMAELLASRN
jgi:hydroxyethylthiazole kinase-like uncharacterized protein yjeF